MQDSIRIMTSQFWKGWIESSLGSRRRGPIGASRDRTIPQLEPILIGGQKIQQQLIGELR